MVEQTGDDPRGLTVVLAANGRQGRAVCAALLADDVPLRATVRPGQRLAMAVEGRGAEAAFVELDDPASIDRAFAGARRVFFYTVPGPNELQQGQNVIDAAVRQSVSHVVYTSHLAADPVHGYLGPYKLAKRGIEQHLSEAPLTSVILRPASFMEYFEGRLDEVRVDGLRGPQHPAYVAKFIAIADVGHYVAQALLRPEQWAGREVNIATDARTTPQLAELFGRILGEPTIFARGQIDDMLLSVNDPERADVLRWVFSKSPVVDLDILERGHAGRISLSQFLRELHNAE